MMRTTTMIAVVVMSAAWAGLGCEGANYVPGGAPGAGSGAAAGTGGESAAGSGGSATATGGSNQGTGGASGSTGGASGSTGGASGSTGGASGSTGGASGSTGGSGGSGGAIPPGVTPGTSTVDEEMLPPAAVYDDTGAIYVSTDGSDSTGNGSMAAPFQTIPHALDVGGAGANIVLRGTPHLGAGQNVYEGAVRIRDPHVTIRSAQGEWAVIQCSTDASATATCVDFDVDASDGKLQRVEVIGGSYYGVAFETKWDWGDADRSGASRIVIEDSKIHDTGRDAVKVKPGCDDIVIRRCEIYNSGSTYPAGATDKNAEGIDNVNADRMVVQDSYIHDTATNGIYFKGGSTDCVIERNRIERAGSAGVLAGFDTSPEFFDLTVNPGYYESIHGVVRNNVIRDVPGDGIGIYASKNPMVFNNTVVNAASSYHSAIYFGLSFQDWDASAGRPATVDPILANNVVVQPSTVTAPVVGIRWSTELGGFGALTGNPDTDYNVYSCAGSACTFEDGRPSDPLSDALFPAWQQHVAGEGHSSTANPGVDTTGHIAAGSLCVDAGRMIPQVKFDIDGQLRSGSYDMGADELAQ